MSVEWVTSAFSSASTILVLTTAAVMTDIDSVMTNFHVMVRLPSAYNIVTTLPFPLLYSDIDECEENSDDCSQLCSNTIGSFTCDCSDELVLATDGKTCKGCCDCSVYSLFSSPRLSSPFLSSLFLSLLLPVWSCCRPPHWKSTWNPRRCYGSNTVKPD